MPDQASKHARAHLDNQLSTLRRRLFAEATIATEMLERSLEGLWSLDEGTARAVREQDNTVDAEEVGIEDECFRLMTLEQPYGHDFRLVAFCLKVNADIERVADHASSISKVSMKISKETSGKAPKWPVALTELAERVPRHCHEVLRAAMDENADEAKRLRAGDLVIDKLDKQLFGEIEEMVQKSILATSTAMHIYRIGRELERVGDLMSNIAEETVYLATGDIVRHEFARSLKLNGPGQTGAGAGPGQPGAGIDKNR